jgi:hypothetical protein
MDTWSGALNASWCATRVCEGSVAEVAMLLASHGRTGARFMVPGAALELRGDVGAQAGVTPVAPARVHHARVRYAPWMPAVRVTVEVDPWSNGRSEVLIRPARRLPVARDRYLAASVALLDAVATDLGLSTVAPSAARVGGPDRLPRAS